MKQSVPPDARGGEGDASGEQHKDKVNLKLLHGPAL